MAAGTKLRNASTMAKALAPENLMLGDFVVVLSEISEYVSFLWNDDACLLPPETTVKIRWLPRRADAPLKVIAVCLPFVLVEDIKGKCRQLDVRIVQLARVDSAYANLAIRKLAGKRV